MKITKYNCFDKNVIESFALSTIAKSFDYNYSSYFSPADTNNFDYLSQDRKKALEVTSVIPENELQAFIYDKKLAQGNRPQLKKVRDAVATKSGALISCAGGSMPEIENLIMFRIKEKNKKALSRMNKATYQQVDLCICISDGGLFDLRSFQLIFTDMREYEFNNIFFITLSHFIRFDKSNNEYTEYKLVV